MLKQTRFVAGIVLMTEAISCFFLVICFLFRDKKSAAKPLALLGLLSAVGGALLAAEKIKEYAERIRILEAMDDICEEDLFDEEELSELE